MPNILQKAKEHSATKLLVGLDVIINVPIIWRVAQSRLERSWLSPWDPWAWIEGENARRANKILRGLIIVRYGMPFDTASPSIVAE